MKAPSKDIMNNLTRSVLTLAVITKIKLVILPIPVRVKKAVSKLTSKVIAPKRSIFLTTNRTMLPMIIEAGIRHYAVVSKFSPRNPVHEVQMAAAVQAGGAGHVLSCGHQLSGSLNFGRRIGTVYFNTAVSDIARNFAGALGQSLKEFDLAQAGVHILKADGGTLSTLSSSAMLSR